MITSGAQEIKMNNSSEHRRNNIQIMVVIHIVNLQHMLNVTIRLHFDMLQIRPVNAIYGCFTLCSCHV